MSPEESFARTSFSGSTAAMGSPSVRATLGAFRSVWEFGPQK